MFDYLSENLKSLVLSYNLDSISEIRLRVNAPIVIQIDGKYREIPNNIAVFTQKDAENLILRLTKRSFYAYNEDVKNGYICGENGERIGLAGKCVYDGDKLLTVKDITSFCIRIPREVKGCAFETIKRLLSEGLKSVLVISPPGGGKTTFLRDSARAISSEQKVNVLVVDEKNELSGNGRFDLGKTTDVIRSGSKSYGFKVGVLNMRPDVIITDELFSESDIISSENAVLSGVSVFASAHGKNVEELSRKNVYRSLFDKKIFDYAVVLSSEKRLGEIKEVVKL